MSSYLYNRLMTSHLSFVCICKDAADDVAPSLAKDFRAAMARYQPTSLEESGCDLVVKGPYRKIDKKLFRLWYGLDTWTGPPNISGIASAHIHTEVDDERIRVQIDMVHSTRIFLDTIPFLFGALFMLAGTQIVGGSIYVGLPFLLLPLAILLISRFWTPRRLTRIFEKRARKYGRVERFHSH